jgi:hypothetical protein
VEKTNSVHARCNNNAKSKFSMPVYIPFICFVQEQGYRVLIYLHIIIHNGVSATLQQNFNTFLQISWCLALDVFYVRVLK